MAAGSPAEAWALTSAFSFAAAHPCRVPGRRVGAVRGRVGAPDRRPFMRAAISSTALAAMKRAAGIADRASPAPRLLAAPRNALRRSEQRQGIGGARGAGAGRRQP